jgi:inhibitor of cysteine peptidase
MNLRPCLALLLAAAPPVAAQEPAPSATPAAEVAPSPAPAGAAAMEGEVKLGGEVKEQAFEIAPVETEPPEKLPEATSEMPGEEPAKNLPDPTGSVDVTEAQNGTIVTAKPGNLVNVKLPANPSTGYNWELRDFEAGVAMLRASEFVAPDGQNMFFGGPGTTVVTLQALEPGTQDIRLVYRRPWEPEDRIDGTFAFRLEVAGDTTGQPAGSPATEPSPRAAP